MPRGRQFAPSVERDGKWFPHINTENAEGSNDGGMTTMGRMLSYAMEPNQKTAPIPKPFLENSRRNYKSSNTFSAHDNRHVFQDTGEYFSRDNSRRWLGKRLYPTETGIHSSQRDMLKHNDRKPIAYDYCTTYVNTNRGTSSDELPVHKRFPKHHWSDCRSPKPITKGSDWYVHKSESHTVPIHVLASSQTPFPKHNSWRYSNNSLHQVYPSYHINRPFPPPVFNKYGAAFMAKN